LASKSFLKQVCRFGLFKKQSTAEKYDFSGDILQAIENVTVCFALRVF
jgi:hypothetical protein